MIVVIGSINLDIVMRPDRLPGPGETVLAPGYRLFAGGKGANQALAARRAGARVAIAGCVGRDGLFARLALASLREAGVDLDAVHMVEAPTGAAAIAVDPAGENQIVVASGANGSVRADQAALAAGDLLVLQMEIPTAQNWRAIERARAAGARSLLNLAPAGPVPEPALQGLDILIANQGEAGALAGQLGRSAADPAGFAAWLAGRFGLDCVVTRGAAGAVAALRDGTRLAAAGLPVKAVDSTAAGDAFVGAYAAALDAGRPPEACLQRAVAAGGLACETAGAQPSLPPADRIEAAAARVAVTRPS